MTKYYTDEELKASIDLFIKNNGRMPTSPEMRYDCGYITRSQYTKRFGTWNMALIELGFNLNDNTLYTKNDAINALQTFYYKYHKIPTSKDTIGKKLPSIDVFQRLFGSWNNALIEAKLPAKYIHHKHSKNDKCSICGTSNESHWYNKYDECICSKCYQSDRKFLKGILDINCAAAKGIVMEHVVYEVLKDCKKCNDRDHFNGQYDLISTKYGNIDVKSVKIQETKNTIYSRWKFNLGCHKNNLNYYICIGLNKTRSKIIHVWLIPRNSTLITKTSISITNSTNGLSRALQYEVDATPYNKIYQNLDITTLSEFRNLNKLNEVSV